MKSRLSFRFTVAIQQPFGLSMVASFHGRLGIFLIVGPLHLLLEVNP